MIEYEPCCGISCASSGTSKAMALKDDNKGMCIGKEYLQHHCQCREFLSRTIPISRANTAKQWPCQESQFITRFLFEIMTSHCQSTI